MTAAAVRHVLLFLCLALPLQAKAAPAPPVPPGQPPRPGPIERLFTPIGARANALDRVDEARAITYVDSIMADAGARGDRLTDAAARFWKGRHLSRDYRIGDAAVYLDSVEKVARAVRDTCMLARLASTRGHGNQINGNDAAAMKYFTIALRLSRATQMGGLEGFVRRGLGSTYKLTGRYEEAMREFNLVLQLVDFKTQEHIHTRLMIGEICNRLGRPDEARVRFDSVLTDARKRGDSMLAAMALHDLAIVAYEEGDMSAADRNWEYAASVYDSLGSAPSAMAARNNRATALVTLGRTQEAMALLERLIAEGERIPDQAQRWASMAELGRLMRRNARFERAEPLLRAVRAAVAETDVAEHDFASLELAGLLRDTGRIPASELLLDSLTSPARKTPLAPDHLAAVWGERSDNRRALGRSAEALAAAHQAERITRRKSGKISIYWLDAVVTLGRCYREAGRPDSAVAVLARAARGWERWRSSISDAEWRERAGAGHATLFAEYGLALLDVRRREPEAARVRKAFDALQVFQARTLEERMHGQGLSARAMARRVTADSLRRGVLREGEVLVDMVATPETSFVFVVSRSRLSVHHLPGTRRLDRLFADWREATLAGADSRAVERGLQRLSSELLAPLSAPLAGSRRVILSGGGSLMLWPFAALTLPGESAALGETREVVSAPSATLFALLRRAPAAPGTAPRLLAVSRTTDAAGRALPGAERELRSLGSGYSGVTVRQNRGEQSVAELTADLPVWDALHFAAHSEADGGSPWRSGFLLGKGSQDAAFFRASTVAGLKLRAKLAVLSGCQSAGAATLAGEGALGLSAGFLCAGTRSVVATLWPVSDRCAERFMGEFYEALAAGRPVAAAVGDAQRALRSRPETANPRDWAAFVALGEPATTLALKRRGPFGMHTP